MSGERLWFIPLALMMTGLALVAVFAAQRDADPDIDLSSVLGMAYPEEKPYWGYYDSAVKLAAEGDWTYFAAVQDGHLCLVQQLGKGFDAKAAGSCTPPNSLEDRAVVSGTSGFIETPTVAFLLPAGYAEAASALDWGRLLSPNLLIVEDFDAYNAGTLALESSEPGKRPLTLYPMKMNQETP